MQGRMQGRILEKFGSEAYVRSQGHMQGHILEEFGSGASGARGTCKGT